MDLKSRWLVSPESKSRFLFVTKFSTFQTLTKPIALTTPLPRCQATRNTRHLPVCWLARPKMWLGKVGVETLQCQVSVWFRIIPYYSQVQTSEQTRVWVREREITSHEETRREERGKKWGTGDKAGATRIMEKIKFCLSTVHLVIKKKVQRGQINDWLSWCPSLQESAHAKYKCWLFSDSRNFWFESGEFRKFKTFIGGNFGGNCARASCTSKSDRRCEQGRVSCR